MQLKPKEKRKAYKILAIVISNGLIAFSLMMLAFVSHYCYGNDYSLVFAISFIWILSIIFQIKGG